MDNKTPPNVISSTKKEEPFALDNDLKQWVVNNFNDEEAAYWLSFFQRELLFSIDDVKRIKFNPNFNQLSVPRGYLVRYEHASELTKFYVGHTTVNDQLSKYTKGQHINIVPASGCSTTLHKITNVTKDGIFLKRVYTNNNNNTLSPHMVCPFIFFSWFLTRVFF